MKSMFPRGQWKLLRGDNVIIRAGKDAGQTGIISKVHRDDKNPGVIVKGMNLVILQFTVYCKNGTEYEFVCISDSSMV